MQAMTNCACGETIDEQLATELRLEGPRGQYLQYISTTNSDPVGTGSVTFLVLVSGSRVL